MTGFPWPVPVGGTDPPVWTGQGFAIGDRTTPILSYAMGQSGWTDDLTAFHEGTAGTHHPIDRASRAYALAQLAHLRTREPVILEVGCSSGFMLRLVRERKPRAFLIGSDYVRSPLEKLAGDMPDIPLLQFDLSACPLPDESVDAVVLLNVLEHVRDDREALRHVLRILRPDGIAVIEVPAGPELYDVYDELLMHHRRYRLPELRSLLLRVGFEIVRASHLGVFAYPAFYAVKKWNKRYLSREQVVQQQVVAGNIQATESNSALDTLLWLEMAVGRWVTWPFGIRCVVTARKAFVQAGGNHRHGVSAIGPP